MHLIEIRVFGVAPAGGTIKFVREGTEVESVLAINVDSVESVSGVVKSKAMGTANHFIVTLKSGVKYAVREGYYSSFIKRLHSSIL